MPKRTNPFQRISASIIAVFYGPRFSVEESVLDRNRRTGVVRELDVRITDREDPKNRILVECRAHRRKQDVQWIDAIDGKARSLKFPKAVAISSSGFTRSALAEARDRSIEALHLKKAEETDWRKWQFALDKFGVNLNFDPVVRSVSIGVPPDWLDKLQHPVNLSNVLLLDLRKQRKIPLREYIRGFQKDPAVVAKLRSLCENDAVNHFDYRVPCDPGIGFAAEPGGPFIPLGEVTFQVDLVAADYSVPLRHMDFAGKRILVGEVVILGRPTRIVLHELPGQLNVMFEQEYAGRRNP